MSSIPLGFLAFALVLAPPTARATPMFTGLGDLPGGAFESFAGDVSADGTVVVGRSQSASGPEAFRWTASGGMVGLGDLQGGSFESAAVGVSADGSVVVGTGHSPFVGGTNTQEAFRWTAAGGMQALGDLMPGGEIDSGAFDVSSDGSTVVGFASGLSLRQEAFRWTSTTGMIGLGGLPGEESQSHANGVSADGSVVVGATSYTFSDHGGAVAFRWTQQAGMLSLGQLPGGTDSHAFAASADGSVVVGNSSTGDGTSEAFRWTSGSGMVGLGNLPGGYASYAFAVSADGSVTVGTGRDAQNQDVALIWDPVNGLRSLESVLAARGLDLTGWNLEDAVGISADGLTITGSGRNPDGQREAWVAFLPEPSTALLVALGLAGTAAVRRRCV